MKIIAAADRSTFIVSMTETEIANIAGHSFPNAIQASIVVGKEIKVAELWRVLEISRERHADLAKMATQLRAQATRIDSINAALANPIVEVKS